MDSAVTVIQVLLALAFAVGGLSQLFIPHANYAKLPAQGWANDFKTWHVKLIGFLKVCAAVGMIVPVLIQLPTMLAPLAALGLALVMAGAIATHLRRMEYPNIIGNLVFLGLALFVAYGTLVEFVV